MEYGPNQVNGGVYTYVNRDGSLMDMTKSVWFQGRFGFITTLAYSHMDRNPGWPSASKSCVDFIEQRCFDMDGHVYFEAMGDGRPLRKHRYTFSECFAAIAISEYALVSGDRTYAEKAPELFNWVLCFITTPGILSPKYYDTLSLWGHSITIILISTASRMREATDNPILIARIDDSLPDSKTFFVCPEFNVLLEIVGGNGEFIDTISERIINSGHYIETA